MGTIVNEGEVWAIPVPRLGYCTLVIARAFDSESTTDFSFAYVSPVSSDTLPCPNAIAPLSEWGQAWIGLVPLRPFKAGRWKLCGLLPNFERSAWPVPPWQETDYWGGVGAAPGSTPESSRWSIETTEDKPTMTPIANNPSDCDEAPWFPTFGIVTAASSFEKVLVHHLKGRRPTFNDMPFDLNDVSKSRLRRWATYAEKVRNDPLNTEPEGLPAGRRTDRDLRAGAWLTFPVTGGGFGAGMLVAKPPKHLRFMSDAVVMVFGTIWEHWPTLADVCDFEPDDGIFVGSTSMICVRDGRWRVLGYLDSFDAEQWVWPYPLSLVDRDATTGRVLVPIGEHENAEIQLDPKVLALDPEVGARGIAYISYPSFERIVALAAENKLQEQHLSRVVTPDRLTAWRVINQAVTEALESLAGRGT